MVSYYQRATAHLMRSKMKSSGRGPGVRASLPCRGSNYEVFGEGRESGCQRAF
jgi:hypothetical protein